MIDDFMREITNLRCEKEQLNSLVNSCQEEIRQLKKQVETYEIEGYKQNEELNKMSFNIKKHKVQQKEFINYLEKKISAYAKAKPFFVEHIHGSYNLMELELNMLKEILANYREIIGLLDENTIK